MALLIKSGLRRALISLFLLSGFSLFAQQDPVAKRYADQILPTNLQDYLSIIASDALEGRKTGSRGQKMAAAFIRAHFEEVGTQGPVNGDFYQPVPLYSFSAGNSVLKTELHTLENFREFVYLGLGESKGVINSIIYIGNGEEDSIDKIDLTGKVVLVISTKGINEIPYSKMINKGAKIIFVCNTKSDQVFNSFASRVKENFSSGELSLTKPTTSGEIESIVFLSPTAVEKLVGIGFSKLQSLADEPKMLEIKLSKGAYELRNNIKQVMSENVLGYLEGTDKKDEVIVMTAHYDHLGKMTSGKGDLINNGADDDGSGTVAIMELAKVFAKAKEEGNGPRRSILFMTVTAEEIGLYGSQYYTDNPIFPLSKTVVDLNIDMIGRSDQEHKGMGDYVYIIGSDKLSKELHKLSERTNSTYTKLALDYSYNDINHPSNLYKRSDHWNFAKNDVPIIFYFDGFHGDYHQPSDEVDKIDFALLAKRTQLVFYTAWELANRDERIKND